MIFPAICACLFGAGAKGDVKVAAGEALKALQRVCAGGAGDAASRVWLWVDDIVQQDEIKRITAT